MDSLQRIVKTKLENSDSLKQLMNKYEALQNRWEAIQSALTHSIKPRKIATLAGFFSPALMALFALVTVLFFTQPDNMTSHHYDPVRYELLLYQTPRDILDRLYYNMSFAEGSSSGVEVSAAKGSFGLRWKSNKSQQITRNLQPFTMQSLIDEYKRYVQQVRLYVQKALAESGVDEETQKSDSKILICIDELDKVLDPDQLHNMLKSLKSVFELEGVYYVLSISEDALESYQLRGLQTKNEVDSTFSHVLKMPPMEVEQSRGFYTEKIAEQFIPLAIVNGGGVPRDMERIVDIIQSAGEEWQKDYYSLLGLFQALAVKTEIFHLLNQWMQDFNVAHPDTWWTRYQKKVDHLREAVYLVSNSPFAANEEVKKAKSE